MSLPKAMLNGSFENLPMDNIYFGNNSIQSVSTVLQHYGVNRVVLITGHSISKNSEIMDRITAILGDRLAGVVSETFQHVPRSSVLSLAEYVKSVKAEGLISLGGGSPNDTMKAIAWALADNIEVEQEFDQLATRLEYPDKVVIPSMRNDPLPMFAIPTTLSAGEFTAFFGITNESSKVKDVFHDKKLTAKAVFLDPSVTLATPEHLWLSTGIRAVDHCVETLLSSKAQYFTDALASHSLRLLFDELKNCEADPEDLEARSRCQIAAWLSFFGISNVTLGLSHGIGHQLGARCNVPHGITSCVMMHNVMGFNKGVTLEKQAWIAALLGQPQSTDLEKNASKAQECIRQFIRDDLGLPWRLRDVGVTEDDLPFLARDAMRDLVVATNPRKVESEDEVIDLLKSSW